MRQMVLVGFLQAQNCTTLASSWRHPESRTDFTTAAYYQKIGQVLEEGKFQLAFFDDRLAMPDIYDGGNPGQENWSGGSKGYFCIVSEGPMKGRPVAALKACP
jgi:hypothetical protein